MGYNTNFEGYLLFNRKLTLEEIEVVLEVLESEDYIRSGTFPYISRLDLMMDREYTGIQWDGMEKTKYLPEKINHFIKVIKGQIADFSLTGTMLAQGEDLNDRWAIIMDKNGVAREVKIVLGKEDKPLCCPSCKTEILVEKFSQLELDF